MMIVIILYCCRRHWTCRGPPLPSSGGVDGPGPECPRTYWEPSSSTGWRSYLFL